MTRWRIATSCCLRRWKPFALAGLWLVVVAGVQVLVRREVLRRIDVEADQIAAREIQARLLPLDLPKPADRLAGGVEPADDVALLLIRSH